MPVGDGISVGTARGSIVIDTSDVLAAQARVRAASVEIERHMGRVGTGAGNMQRGLGVATNSLRGVAGAFGVAFGAAAIAQITRYGIAVEGIATSYQRQEVAARGLAGSQAQLNEFLRTYNEATGGAIDRATALSDVTRLMAVGFADSSEELERFATAARGISIATGQTQEYVISQLQLAIANQSELRLDQLGLGVSEVKERVDELKAANSNLTNEMAYQQAILSIAQEKFGAVARSADAQKTGVEDLRRAWSDLGLTIGGVARGPVNEAAQAMADAVDSISKSIEEFRQGQRQLNLPTATGGLTIETNRAGAQQTLDMLQQGRTRVLEDIRTGARPASVTGPLLAELDAKIRAATNTLEFFERAVAGAGSGISDRVRGNALKGVSGGGPVDRFTDEETAAIVDWSRARTDIEKATGEQVNQISEQYASQRASTIRQYEQTIAREAQDFATQRARAEQQLAQQIADIRAGAVEREARQVADLERSIGQARADSADRVAQMQADHDRQLAERRQASQDRIAEWEVDRNEAIAERRQEGAKRLLEVEEDYQRDRERAAAQSRDNILSAAARLDARSVWEEQRRFARENEQALEAHDERVSDEKQQLDEAIRQLEDAHRERLDDEKKALDKSIEQAKEAYNRQVGDEKAALDKRIDEANKAYATQLEDARKADDDRILDMQKHFDERIAQEDADRATRLARLATDHNNQLIEQDRQHGERIKQIERQGVAERKKLDEEFEAALADLGLQTNAYLLKQKGITDGAIEEFDRFWKHINGEFQKGITIGPETKPPPDPTPSLDPRRDQIRATLDKLYKESGGLTPGSPRWLEISRQVAKLEEELRNLGGGATASLFGGNGMTAGASSLLRGSTTLPTAGMASAGTGGGRNVSITLASGAITVTGVSGQTAEQLYHIIDNRLLTRIRQAAAGA